MPDHFDPDRENYVSTLHSPHSSYRLYYHLVWGTKHRKPALIEGISSRLIQVVTATCEKEGCQLLGIHVEPEHVHALISLRPTHNVADIVNRIKGTSARTLRLEFPELSWMVDEKSLWTNGYCAHTVGDANVAQIKAYLDKQKVHHHG